MNNRPEPPDFYKGRKPDHEEDLSIVWSESDDVYKPIAKDIYDFMRERKIRAINDDNVYINADARMAFKAHLKSNLQVEQGGILFGNAYKDPVWETIYVDITAAVAAPATVGTGAHLDFTPSSWTGIMDHARAHHPGDKIVGWYHSHPNLSAFMSETDMNTQRSFFYHPWCLSIVYDPCREDMKFFLGRTAQAVRPSLYGNLPDEEAQQDYGASLIHNESSDIINWQDENRHRGRARRKENIKLGFILFCVALILLLYFGGSNIFNLSQQSSVDTQVPQTVRGCLETLAKGRRPWQNPPQSPF